MPKARTCPRFSLFQAEARAEAAEHYRKGWKEKDAAGAPLVDGLIDLPDRLPGPGTDNLVAPGGFDPSFKLPEVGQ